MNSGSHGTLRSAALAALLLMQGAAHAIEKPKQIPPPEAPPPEAPAVTIAPTDEAQFQQVLQRVTLFRNMRGLNVSDQVIDQLARGETDQAVAALSTLAAQGNRSADIALVRVQHWCNTVSSARLPDWQSQLPQIGKQFPPERAPPRRWSCSKLKQSSVRALKRAAVRHASTSVRSKLACAQPPTLAIRRALLS